ncbi:MAG: VWA domain-containing protein [Proteobacteria bacterium]|nr:VWA domain-containing protein [Pseudomonadota bacterium]
MSVPTTLDPGGTLAANLMHFARILRTAGLPIGPGRVLDGLRAVAAVGIQNRADFYWTLHAVFVSRRDQRDIFDQAFRLYWRDPALMERMKSILLPPALGSGEAKQPAMSRRLAEALHRGERPSRPPMAEQEDTIDMAMTWSDRELLRTKDFEQMSAAELAAAKQAMARLKLTLMQAPTRRFKPDRSGTRADLRATLRATLRSWGDVIALKFRARRRRPPPLVVLCDISGSMERYSRMFLHFLHALANDRDRVHTFLFGTRLTNITRQLRYKDVDRALEKVAHAVEDWSGGTRIGKCLAEFNLRWARRVLGQNAVVLFISDGLDRDAAQGLAPEMERLHKSCRRLIWLNPLLRFAGFEPKSLGNQAILPHVDDFRPAHNLQSLAEIAVALSAEHPRPVRGKIGAMAA